MDKCLFCNKLFIAFGRKLVCVKDTLKNKVYLKYMEKYEY
jgi:hypothetical protein